MLESRFLDDPRVGIIFEMPIIDLPESGRMAGETYWYPDAVQPKLRKENRVLVGEEILEKLRSAQVCTTLYFIKEKIIVVFSYPFLELRSHLKLMAGVSARCQIELHQQIPDPHVMKFSMFTLISKVHAAVLTPSCKCGT